MSLKKVLVTGVYGLIGNLLYAYLLDCGYDVHGLARRRHASARIPPERVRDVPDDHFVLSDLSDLADLQRAVRGMDVVLHLAADPDSDAAWESVLASNIVATYNVFEACRQAQVRRVVFASSIQVSFGWKDTEPYRTLFEARYDDAADEILPVTHRDAPRPPNLYASSKVWGEALAHSYAQRYGMSCICIRVGWVVAEDRPPNRVGITQWSSQRDIVQIFERCIAAPDSVGFEILYGVSDNEHRWVDIEHARRVVGYVPQDGATT